MQNEKQHIKAWNYNSEGLKHKKIKFNDQSEKNEKLQGPRQKKYGYEQWWEQVNVRK